MNIDERYISALEAHGYTKKRRDSSTSWRRIPATSSRGSSSRFLVQWGKRTTLFWNKLHANKHARTSSLPPKHRAVYHLFARKCTGSSAARIFATAADTNWSTSSLASPSSILSSQIPTSPTSKRKRPSSITFVEN